MSGDTLPVQPVIEGFPLSAQQARAWSADEGSTRAARLVLAVQGPLDLRALHAALQTLVERHEILRTTFQALPEMQMPLQVIEPIGAAHICSVDMSQAVRVDHAALVARVFAREAADPRRTTSALPTRCVVIRRSAESHTIVVTQPALCADYRSLGNLASELMAEYSSAAGQMRRPEEPTAPLQYVDFGEWQREMPASDGAAAAGRFWLRQCGPSTAVTIPFPSDDRPTGRAFRFTASTRQIGPERLARIRERTAGDPVSDEAFWMACWSLLLWRLSRRTDIAVGRMCEGRRYPEMRAALGPFAKSLPIRCRGSWSTSFTEHASAVQQTLTEADESQDFYDVTSPTVHAANRGDDRAWPLAFELRRGARPRQAGPASFTIVEQACIAEPFLLKLTCTIGEAEISTEVAVDADRVPDLTASRLVGQLHRIVDLVLDRPDRTAAQLDLETQALREAVTAQNRTAVAFAGADRPLAWAFEAQVARVPDAIAIAGVAEAVTYAGLNRAANRIARALRARGVGPDSRVAVLIRRSPALLAALLGVTKAGAAYVPFDPSDPPGRLMACLADANMTDGLIGAGLEPPTGTEVHWLRVDDPRSLTAVDDLNPPTPDGGDRLAYVIYTSGSTGTPKGALITQRGLMNYLLWSIGHYGFTHGVSALLHSSAAFDLTVTSLFAPLITGGAVTLAPDISPAEALAHGLRAGRHVDVVKLTPSHLQALSWQLEPAALGAGTDALIIGGEALHGETLCAWRDAAPHLRCFNEYGPTETVVGSCIYEVAAGDVATGPVPIGTPIANTQVYVLDPFGVPVLPGLDGELFLGGAGIARGYLNRPDLTADRFVPDPFGGMPGARLYRTGDIVRWSDAGGLRYIGRGDQQVKLRGHRVELGDVEAALRTLAEVREAAASVRQDQPGTTQLVVYVVPSGQTRLTLEELRSALARTLPDYMLPDILVWMDALPLAPSGKVDRRALPPPPDVQERAGSLVRATTEVEEILAAIWADVLGVDEVGVHDNFFALGGDSIRAIQVRARGRERGLDISHEQLFEHQTLAALARGVGFDAPAIPDAAAGPLALVGEADRAALPPDVEDAYPIAALQAGMIFHSELADDSGVFHDLHSFRIGGTPVDVGLLRAALADVMGRHATLRTGFELARYSRPLQLVYRDVTPPLEVTDLRDLPPDERSPTVEAWLEGERRRPFNWREAPLLRFHVHVFGGDAFQFTLSFHHAMLDGWSAASLLTELFNRYGALLERPDAPPEPALRSTFRDFVALEQQAEASEPCRQFWRETLRTASPTRLARPAAGGPARAPVDRIGTRAVAIDRDVMDGLRRLARALALPLKSVVLAAHAKVLASETDQSRILTGLVANGRPEHVDGDRVLGLFLNTVPCIVPVGAGRWRDLAFAAFDAERRLLRFRRYPLARMQQERGEAAPFDAAFNFMHYHVYRSARAAESMHVDGYSGYEETDVPLMANFGLDPQSGDLTLLLAYHPQTFSPDEIERLAGRYRTVLATMAANPDAPHDATDLLTAEEREEIVSAGRPRDTAPWAPDAELSIVASHAAQADATPEAVAVAFGDTALTYGALHARADRLARHLRAVGVGPDVPVAVCLDRSPELIVGLLAIMKAGGAYLPLDPTYPPARLALVLEAARPAAIVTQAAHVARLAAGADVAQTAIVRLDADWQVIAAAEQSGLDTTLRKDAARETRIAAGQLAYVMYTSGSTGQPKGVMVPHGTVLNFMSGMDQRVGPIAQASWLAVTSVAFDISVLELIWTLTRGARVVLLPAETSGTGLSPLDLIEREGVTHVQCTPSWAWRLVHQIDAAAGAGRALERLEQLLVGGEALPPELADELRRRVGGRLHNMYGPTETTIWSSSDEISGGAVTLGYPILNTRLHVRERHGHLVPCGAAGEICIAGDGVARGYVDRADLTAERFVPDPFGDVPGARMYRTGDWGRMRSDGRVEFIGRRDAQVKLRGHRIELAEIDAALRAQPDVREAVAVLREDTPGERRLVGYVVPVSAGPIATDALQQRLREQVPAHMVPALIVTLDALPLTPNGKIDRHRLPAPAGERPALSQPYEPPRTDLEATIARIWSEVLHIAQVGVHDNFFALGGHSLNATQVIARLRDACGVDLPLRPLFEAPTIARLAPIIVAHRAAAPADDLDALAAAAVAATPDLDALIDRLEQLPDDEVRALLGDLA